MVFFSKSKTTDVQEPMDLESVMKKFDRESNTRVWEGIPQMVVRAFLGIFSVFCIYVTLFASWLEEFRLTTFVAFIVFLGYIVYPAKKGKQKVNYIPWYDILLMIMGTGAFLYFAFNAKDIVAQGSKFEAYQIIIGICGIVSLLEVCRRSVGLPIVIVAAVFIVYALFWGTSNPKLLGKIKYVVHRFF